MAHDDVHLLQSWYPRIYLACHTRHQRAASSPTRLSARDSSLLAHLHERRPVSPAELARHVAVRNSTMSAAVKRLVNLGYVERSRDGIDGRRVHLRLSAKGARAMRDSSVLEPARVQRLLRQLTASERRRALEGLALLARAAERMIVATNEHGRTRTKTDWHTHKRP